MNNQRLTWFLIGNLIGLGGLLLVVFASDAARRSSPEPLARHSSSRQASQAEVIVKAPKTMPAPGEKATGNLAQIKTRSSANSLKKPVSGEENKPASQN